MEQEQILSDQLEFKHKLENSISDYIEQNKDNLDYLNDLKQFIGISAACEAGIDSFYGDTLIKMINDKIEQQKQQQDKRFSYKKKQGLWEIYDSWQNNKCVKKVKAITSLAAFLIKNGQNEA